jgi:glutathione S-transferase
MKLLAATASPYSRKVRIVLAEKKIECDMQMVDVAPVENPVNAHNPLGKIPTLLLDDGSALYDSRVIVEWLTTTRGHGGLTPPRDRWHERNIVNAVDEALGSLIQLFYLRRDGIAIDGNAFAERQLGRVEAILAWLPGQLTGGFGLAEVSVICALDWMDFRQTYPTERAAGLGATRDAWRDRPSVAETRPHM